MSTYTKYTGFNPTPSGFDYVTRITSLTSALDSDFTLESNRIDTLVTKTSGINALGDTFTGDLVGNASTATILQNSRTINGTSFNGSANININTYIGAINPSADTSMYPVLVGANTVTNQVANTDASFVYNSTTKALTATTFIGNLTGNVTGNWNGLSDTAFAKLATDNTYTGRQNFQDFSEKSVSFGTSGSIALNTSLGSYFYASGAATGIITFSFTNPSSTGVTSFTVELSNAGTYNPVWPASVDWPGNVEPGWSTGKDIVSFSSRDNGTTWLGYYGGGAFA